MRPLDPEYRFSFKAGVTGAGLSAPEHYLIVDQQQEKWFQVVAYDESATDPDREDVDEDTKYHDAIQILADHVDSLDESIRTIRRACDGTLTFTSEDLTPELDFPIFQGETDEIIAGSQLILKDRLGPSVYLVRPKYQQSHDQRLYVYKYSIVPRMVQKMWDETQIIKRLTGHKHFAQLYKLVTHDDLLHVVGFTTHYVPGETLLENVRPFRFGWLKDITSAIDYLNYEVGIVHGDMAARNVLVDSRNNTIKIIDFDRAYMTSRTGGMYWDHEFQVGYNSDERDTQGVICTIYDAFTKLEHLGEPDSIEIEKMQTWCPEIPFEEIEGGFNSYISFVLSWAEQRRSSKQYVHFRGHPMKLVNLGIKELTGIGPDCFREPLLVRSREWYEAEFRKARASVPDRLRSRENPFFNEHDYRVQLIRDHALSFTFIASMTCIAVGLWQRRLG
ncbi:MAG: hypothetical protein M1812_004702 [Candelaria pacifica]|nr:MAG: hypothetical protein M1812_004702 [Candelaria pacifica]